MNTISICFQLRTFNKHLGSNMQMLQEPTHNLNWTECKQKIEQRISENDGNKIVTKLKVVKYKIQKGEDEFDWSRIRTRKLDRSLKWTRNRKDWRWIGVQSENIRWNYLSRMKNKTETANLNWICKTLRIGENCDNKGFLTRNANWIWHWTRNWIREGETVLEEETNEHEIAKESRTTQCWSNKEKD